MHYVAAALGLVVLALAGTIVGLVVTRHHQASGTPAPLPPPATTAAPQAPCPLTGVPSQAGVPARPALAVKVDNQAEARPQAGLAQADIVYEEPVEGGITRFVAIYQCNGAASVEPVRSARLVDAAILIQLGRPLFAYSGGIAPAVAAIRGSGAYDVGQARAQQAYHLDPRRAAPHDLVTSTAALWSAGAAEGAPATAPQPVFPFGPMPAGAQPASSVHIAYLGSNVQWTWDATRGLWLRSYLGLGTTPALLADGSQVAATNVVVQRVVLTRSPYIEDATGVHENYVGMTGSGPATVYRDGSAINGTWSRPAVSDPTQLLGPSGQTITLAPGTTWVELVPTTVVVTTAP